jgi:hypothetical protein
VVREHYSHVAESLIFGKTSLRRLGEGRQSYNALAGIEAGEYRSCRAGGCLRAAQKEMAPFADGALSPSVVQKDFMPIR